MKEFTWHGCIVQITKKKIKNTNLRIKPAKPQIIHISIPCATSYQAALQLLDQPRILRWIEKCQEKVSEHPEEKLKQKPYYQKRLEDVLPKMFAKWEPILGIKSQKVTIRDTKSQWGSCNTANGNISISVWLGAFKEDCIEYVVVHELAHLLERGHNERFYSILDKHYPAWRTCKEQLKKGL